MGKDKKKSQDKAQDKTAKKMGLTTQIFIGLLAGAVVGILINYFMPAGHIRDDIIIGGVLYVVGQGFIRLMQMLVVPLVFCSLVCGSMSIGDTKKLGGVGVKTLAFYLFTTALAITVALLVGNLIDPGMGLDMNAISVGTATTAATEPTSLSDTLLNIIPTNIFGGLAEGNMLQVILFALLVGIILAKLGERVDVVARFTLKRKKSPSSPPMRRRWGRALPF